MPRRHELWGGNFSPEEGKKPGKGERECRQGEGSQCVWRRVIKVDPEACKAENRRERSGGLSSSGGKGSPNKYWDPEEKKG